MSAMLYREAAKHEVPVFRPPPASVPPLIHGSHTLSRVTGRSRGTIVHEQLDAWIKLGPKSFRLLHPNKHPYVTKVLEAISARRWKPFSGEFPVYNKARGIGTELDTILSDREGNIVAVELKTGYRDGIFDNEDGHAWKVDFLEPFVRCTPFGRAVVQLILSAELLRVRWSIPREKIRLCIIRVDDAHAELSELNPALFQELGPVLLDAIAPLSMG